MMQPSRSLTTGERELARSVFGEAIHYDPVRIHHRKWFPFQPKDVAMAPTGHIHFHPHGSLWSPDFAQEPVHRQGLFIHEITHVWQTQLRGRLYLPLMRHPFCRYRYAFEPGRPFDAYGLEQQAEIVRHVFLMRNERAVPAAPALEALEDILPF